MKRPFCFFSLLFCLFVSSTPESSGAPYPVGVADDEIMATAYQGNEKLRYNVSWSGGIKIGELRMEVIKLEGRQERFELRAKVTSTGLFRVFYPVEDTFVTVVEGAKRLPVTYEVHQKEGRSSDVRRHTEYNQVSGEIRYRKNDRDPVLYQVKEEVHNEFSSFFFTRVLQMDPAKPSIVPTFADGKRHEVVVRTGERTRIRKTVKGDVNVLSVTPIMKFKGLYDKDGDTVIWFTDDICRIPVRVNSKILIGSLTAELVSYNNPLCLDQSEYHNEIPESVLRKQELEAGDYR